MEITEDLFNSVRQEKISGRYITNDHIRDALEDLSDRFSLKTIGYSVEERPIMSIEFGMGSQRILMWSQMHGNESTTTKAVLDLLRFLDSGNEMAVKLQSECSLMILPILNPDGAKAYTRVNANKVDLNRDAQERTQPESVILRTCFDQFKPNYCLNLHDQRSIFNVGTTPKVATVSFLAPAHDTERSISKTRKESMQLISAMNKTLQQFIPGQVGRYDDSFNPNCIGDTFQMQNIPTVLFEAGHYPDDYQREHTRKYIFLALLAGLGTIAQNMLDEFLYEAYFDIPQNGNRFFDILIKNPYLINPTKYGKTDVIGVLYTETLEQETINFIPEIKEVGVLKGHFGHLELDCQDHQDILKLNTLGIYDKLI